jgi:hypothetical protein
MYRRVIAVFVLAMLAAAAFGQNALPKQTVIDDLG